MNNRFIVLVLAFGIATLGAAASPAQAVTASLGSITVVNTTTGASATTWVNTVTMTSVTTWTDAYLYQAKDASGYGTLVCDGGPGNVVGPGTFTETEPVPTSLAPVGHSVSTWILDAGHDHGAPVGWGVSTNVVTLVTK